MISVLWHERVIYLRYDIALSCDDICLRHMEERILYHTCEASISYGFAVYHIALAIYH